MKFGLMMLMVVASWFVYDHRDLVLDAYRESDAEVDVRLTGVDLDVEKTPLAPSPFQILNGEDTRRKPLDLAFVDAANSETTVSMRGGTATLSGTAFVNSAPASGAIVRVERHTAEGLGSIDVQASNNGSWLVDDLPGGRYRLRSWQPGEAVDRAGTVFFLEAGEARTHSFRLEEVDEKVAVQLNNSGAMFDGLTGSVGVAASRRQVDGDGLIVTAPVPGARVTLTVTGAATLESTNTVTVDSSGHATFKLRCTRPGSVAVSASVFVPALSRSKAAETGDRSSNARPADNAKAIKAVGRHPGCREIPPPPPTTIPPTTNPDRSSTSQGNDSTRPTSTSAPTDSSESTTGIRAGSDG